MAHRFLQLAIASSIFVGLAATTLAQDNRLPDRQPGAQHDPHKNPHGMPQPGQPGYIQPGQPGYVQPGQQGYVQPGQPGYVQPGQPGQWNSNYGQPNQQGMYGQNQQGMYGQNQQGMGVMQVGHSGCGCDSGASMMSYSGYGYSGGYDNGCCKQRRSRRCCR